MPEKEMLYSKSAIGEALGISRSRVTQLMGQLPEPDMLVNEGKRVTPVWRLETLLVWNDARLERTGKYRGL